MELGRRLAECRDDPVAFSRLIGWTEPDRNALAPHQEGLVRLVATHKTVVCPAGHSVGKSRCAALLIAWWLMTRPGSLVLVTAPSQHLVGTVIFKELRRLYSESRIPLGGTITRKMKAAPQTWELGDGWACIGFSSNTLERVSGQHNPHLLVIVDEASGVDDEIWEGVRSWNYEKLVVLGNPLKALGEFPRLFRRTRLPDEQALPAAERAVNMVISSLDSPHKDLERSPCGLADRAFLNEVARDYGIDSLYWRLHVDIDKDNPFPAEDHEQLIPASWLDRCVSIPRAGGGIRALAMDVAKGTGRHRTVIVVGDPYGLHLVWQSNRTSIPEAAQVARDFARQYGIAPSRCAYDAGGWAGDDMARYLAAVGFGAARKYYGGDSGGPRFKNKRSWVAWRLRTRLDPNLPAARPYEAADPTMPLVGPAQFIHPTPVPQPGFAIPMGPYWPELREELLGLRYGYDGAKTALETKEDYMLRLGRSPDLADTLLILTSVLWGEMEL